MVFATVLGVAIPIKIWNSARIEHRLQEQEKLLLAARVAALASQINPHFLFNTLTSISSLIRSQPETARTLIVKLSGLLRRLLRSQEHFVTLREELEAIDEYLDIEAIRFGPKLTIEKSIDPASLDVVVPSMLLQPLVENSIKHGLSPKIGEGRILIRSTRADGHSIIDIIDNGVGRHATGTPTRAQPDARQRHRPAERQRTPARHLRRELPAPARQCSRRRARARGSSFPSSSCRRRFRPDAMPTTDKLRTVVVDDERLAREELCFLLGQIAGIDVVAQAGDGAAALDVIAEHTPDLVMLDVQMPGLTGFEVARRLLRGGTDSHLVFVTAYDRHAIEAFDVNAVDYLLKPVEAERLAMAVERVRKRMVPERGNQAVPGGLDRVLQLFGDRQNRREQLAVKVGERFILLQTDEVVHASVEDDVITVVTNSLSGTSNYRTLDELQARLDPEVFWRVHRSHLVNINKIREIVPWFSRNFILKMKDAKGSEIPVSRSQTRRLREYLRL